LSNNRAVRATKEKLESGKYSVDFKFFADKIRVTKVGEEEPLSMNDFITFGVFGADGEELYLEKHKIQSGSHELTFIVDGIPAKVGIDPNYYLIDKNPNDNVITIE
jgi:ABC-2 type transport system permease protein